MRIGNSNVGCCEIDSITPRRLSFWLFLHSGLVKEMLDRRIEGLGDHLKSAGRNLVGSSLILLHLLERYADHSAKFLLAHAPERSKAADTIANEYVDWIGQGGLLSKQSQDRALDGQGLQARLLTQSMSGSRAP